ncbi:MAG: Flp pilus assembly protein CpaB [Gemmataceae bacterium]
MKPKTLMLMGVAIVCGLVASYMTSRLIAEKNETVKVLVAKGNMQQWTPVRDPQQMFEEKEVPKNQAPPTYIPPSAIGEMKDRPLIKNMKKEQVVTWEDLQSKEKAGLEALLPQGKRAFAIETSARTAAGGFILPGSHVDIILTKRNQVSTDVNYVLEDVLVRAVDLMPVRPDDRPGMVPSTVTLEVTPEEALKLAKVKQAGEFTLTLRPFGDKKKHSETVAVAPPPPPPIPEPVAEETVKDPMTPKEKPLYEEFIQDTFNGSRWERWCCHIDKQTGKVVKRFRVAIPGEEGAPTDASGEPAANTPAATPAADDSVLPTPGVSNE